MCRVHVYMCICMSVRVLHVLYEDRFTFTVFFFFMVTCNFFDDYVFFPVFSCCLLAACLDCLNTISLQVDYHYEHYATLYCICNAL